MFKIKIKKFIYFKKKSNSHKQMLMKKLVKLKRNCLKKPDNQINLIEKLMIYNFKALKIKLINLKSVLYMNNLENKKRKIPQLCQKNQNLLQKLKIQIKKLAICNIKMVNLLFLKESINPR